MKAKEIGNRGNKLTLDIAKGLRKVFSARACLESILTNLLSNVAKYTPAGREIVRCSATDNGLGTSAEEQRQLFVKYYRSADRKVREMPVQSWAGHRKELDRAPRRRDYTGELPREGIHFQLHASNGAKSDWRAQHLALRAARNRPSHRTRGRALNERYGARRDDSFTGSHASRHLAGHGTTQLPHRTPRCAADLYPPGCGQSD